MQLEKIAVVGATGYSGEELIRLLQRHPGTDLVCVTSRQSAGKPLRRCVPEIPGTEIRHARIFSIRSRVDSGLGCANSLSGAAPWSCGRVCAATAGCGIARHRSQRGFPAQGQGGLQGILRARSSRAGVACAERLRPARGVTGKKSGAATTSLRRPAAILQASSCR